MAHPTTELAEKFDIDDVRQLQTVLVEARAAYDKPDIDLGSINIEEIRPILSTSRDHLDQVLRLLSNSDVRMEVIRRDVSPDASDEQIYSALDRLELRLSVAKELHDLCQRPSSLIYLCRFVTVLSDYWQVELGRSLSVKFKTV